MDGKIRECREYATSDGNIKEEGYLVATHNSHTHEYSHYSPRQNQTGVYDLGERRIVT